FFFPVLAACLALGLYAERSARTTLPRTLLLAVLIVAVNQVIAELVRPLIVARYPWSYDLPVARRAAQRFPIGAFSLDQRANQALASPEWQELPVYEQGATVSRYDRTPVPPVRRFELR